MTLISPISETKVSGVRQFCTVTFVHSELSVHKCHTPQNFLILVTSDTWKY